MRKSELKNLINEVLSTIPVNLNKVNSVNTDKEILRVAILAELDAINLYEQLAENTINQSLKKTLLDIAKEEKTHVGEFQALLLELDKEQEEELKTGEKEVEDLSEKNTDFGREKLRAAKITFENGDTITTSLASDLTDEDIYDYYKIGKTFNIGNVKDNLQKVADVEILREIKKMENPCWKGYKPYGTKIKDGKEVPNCVPIKENLSEDELCEAYQILEKNAKKAGLYEVKGKEHITEAEYRGRKVQLNKIMPGDVKKFKVYVKNDKGNVVKVNFGQKGVRIKKDNPERRKSFRARHKCDTPGPKWKARYWACKTW